MSWRKILVGMVFSTAVIFQFQPMAQAVTDDTTCWVRDYCDEAGSIEYFSCLRHKIEQGFNQKVQRSCVELIKFNLPANQGNEAVIRITKQLYIDGTGDYDCEGDHDLCGDDTSFEIAGNSSTQSAKVVLDTTGMSDDRCAIKVKGFDMKFHGFKIRSNQPNLKAKYDEHNLPSAVICEVGGGSDFVNDYDGVEFEGHGEECGNGVVEGHEACDAGSDNGQAGSGCSETCTESSNGDEDHDTIPDAEDNCSPTDPQDHCSGDACANTDQKDCDQDGIGDVCDQDWDNDGVNDDQDNCSPSDFKDAICSDASLTAVQKAQKLAEWSNAPTSGSAQDNTDGDAYGDLCDDNLDGDTVPNDTNGDKVPNTSTTPEDNCPSIANSDQVDVDHDGVGAACDPDDSPAIVDVDGDHVSDDTDNCVPGNPNHHCDGAACANPLQEDLDLDHIGNACDEDKDGDGKPNVDESDDPTQCPLADNPDSDGDGVNDGTDPCPCDAADACNGPGAADDDFDGKPNDDDNCPALANIDQIDSDGDNVGDACDPDNPAGDTDSDGTLNAADNCPLVDNRGQEDSDGDKIGDACDTTPDVVDGDGIDANVDDGSGSGCFNSLSGVTEGRDCLSWALFGIIALGMKVWRSVGKDLE